MSLLKVDHIGATVVLTLNDPERRNILSSQLCEAISAAVADAATDPQARSLVVTGEGPAFCAGADLADLLAASEGDTVAVRAVYQAFMDLAESPLPTVAAVNGAAVGAGFNLALACDMRVASERARFDTRFLKIGLHPGGGHTWMLLRAIGWAEASRLLLGGQVVDAAEALRIGLVQQVAPPQALLETAMAFVAAAAAAPRELVERTKASLRRAATSSHAVSYADETAEQMWSLSQPEFKALTSELKAAISTRAG